MQKKTALYLVRCKMHKGTLKNSRRRTLDARDGKNVLFPWMVCNAFETYRIPKNSRSVEEGGKIFFKRDYCTKLTRYDITVLQYSH